MKIEPTEEALYEDMAAAYYAWESLDKRQHDPTDKRPICYENYRKDAIQHFLICLKRWKKFRKEWKE
jgi:hypothetical protein